MKFWYELIPMDTLFFRGNEPMEAGQAPSVPLFPPPVSVLLGAFRTGYLVQKRISFPDYKRGNVSDEVISTIGKCGQDPPFSVTAILLRRNGEFYAPAPAHWFVDSEKKPQKGDAYKGLKVLTCLVRSETLKKLSVVSSSLDLPMVVTKNEASSLAGTWVRLELFGKGEITLAEGDVLTAGELYDLEPRIGIGLTPGKTVEDGKLYNANHLRLRDGVTIAVGFDHDPGVAPKGVIQLGGEQRRCWYQQTQGPVFSGEKEGPAYMNLSPVRAEADLLTEVIATGKLQTTAGWDLSIGFHKPTVTWFPAGAVFRRKISNSCISIEH